MDSVSHGLGPGQEPCHCLIRSQLMLMVSIWKNAYQKEVSAYQVKTTGHGWKAWTGF